MDKVRSICDNDAGSGYCGSVQEALNFDAVSQALVEQGACVLVYESPSVDALLEGKLYGPWKLGQGDGFCMGMLVWLAAEAHVLRGWNWNIAALQSVGVVDAWAPWLRYVVGAPKKSKRGANVKKGGSGYEARHGESGAEEGKGMGRASGACQGVGHMGGVAEAEGQSLSRAVDQEAHVRRSSLRAAKAGQPPCRDRLQWGRGTNLVSASNGHPPQALLFVRPEAEGAGVHPCSVHS